MNNKFDWNRFCKVVAKDCRNLWPMFGITMLVLAVLPAAAWLFMLVTGIDTAMSPDIRLVIIEALAYLAAVMAPSRLYRTWNLQGEGIYFAMLPASKLEKFASALLFSIVVCPLLVYLGGMAVDVVLTALPFGPWEDWLWQTRTGFPFTLDMSFFSDLAASDTGANAMHFGTLWVVACWVGFIGSVLMFMFTSTLFKKHKVLQTILWLYVIEFVLSLVIVPVMMALFGNSIFMDWLMHLPEQLNGDQVANWAFGSALVFDVVLVALFGWLSWRRLKRMAY